MFDPRSYSEIPENPHGIRAGCVLLPTDAPIVLGGGNSQQFIEQQGGDEDTFILMLGLRQAEHPLGQSVSIVEGIFLNEDGPGFHATWDYDQLMRETRLGGWVVVPTDDVLSDWLGRVEERMNA